MEIPQSSASLYDLLAKEIFARVSFLLKILNLFNFKETRIRALSQSLNVRDVEQILRKMIDTAKDEEQDFRFVS